MNEPVEVEYEEVATGRRVMTSATRLYDADSAWKRVEVEAEDKPAEYAKPEEDAKPKAARRHPAAKKVDDDGAA